MSAAIDVLYIGLPERCQLKLDAVIRQYRSLRMPEIWIRRVVSERQAAMREGRE